MFPTRLYYQLKPLIPPAVRLSARRWLARTQRARGKNTWPILPGSEQPPPGWTGWPEGKRFALVLTHDVEGQRGLDKCRQLMELEMRLGFRSSFNFIPEGEYRVPAELRKELAGNGFEIGVHDLHHDGKLYFNRQHFAEKAARINHYLKEWGAVGFRSGFMLRNLEWLHDLEIEYDASTFDTDPFEPQPDGANTIFPFWVARDEESRKQKISAFQHLSRPGYVELPYTLVQDSNLFIVLKEKSADVWKKKLDWVASNGGMAMVIVHPDYINFGNGRSSHHQFSSSLYEEFLKYVKTEYAGQYWQALPREVARYVHSRQNGGVHSRDNGGSNGAPAPASQNGAVDAELESLPLEPAFAPRFGPREELAQISQDARTGPVSAQELPASELPLNGQRAAVVLFSYYPSDPRPRRAAEALAKEGMIVDLICLKKGDAESRRETFNGVNIFRLPIRRRRGSKIGYVFQYAAFIVASFLILAFRSLTRRYHLVHVHNMPDVLVFSGLVPKILGAKVILDLHDPMPELMETIFNLRPDSAGVSLLKRTEKWSIAFADTVLTPNIAFKKLFAERSCRSDKIHIVMNSPNEETFRFQPAADAAVSRDPSKPFVILYHGSLVARHGLDIAIDAVQLVRRSVPSATIMICGETTSYFERVMDTARERGLAEWIRYMGMRNRKQIVEAIEQCDVGVIPNRRSVFTEINMPTRIFEYLALAKPVIAPSTKGIEDYFGTDDLVFFEPDNVRDLAAKIEYVYFHPEEINRTVARGQAIYQNHRWSHERSGFVALTERLLRSGTESQVRANAEIQA